MATTRTRGGQKIAAMIRHAKAEQGRAAKLVEIGFYRDAKYSDGTPVTNVAAFNNFGTRGGGFGGPTPARPFFTNALPDIRKSVHTVLRARVDPRTMAVTKQIAGIVGEASAEDVRRSITELRSPPNSPITIARKGSSNPLLDLGFMRASTTYRVT